MTSINVNRDHWNRASGDYQELHGPQIGAAARLWGMFSLPDADGKCIEWAWDRDRDQWPAGLGYDGGPAPLDIDGLLNVVAGEHPPAELVTQYVHALYGNTRPVPEEFFAAAQPFDGRVRRIFSEHFLMSDEVKPQRRVVAEWQKPIAVIEGDEEPFFVAKSLDALTWKNLWRGKVQYIAGSGHALLPASSRTPQASTGSKPSPRASSAATRSTWLRSASRRTRRAPRSCATSWCRQIGTPPWTRSSEKSSAASYAARASPSAVAAFVTFGPISTRSCASVSAVSGTGSRRPG